MQGGPELRHAQKPSAPKILLKIAALYMHQGLPYGFFHASAARPLRDAGFRSRQSAPSSRCSCPGVQSSSGRRSSTTGCTRKGWLLPLQLVRRGWPRSLLAALEPGDGYLLFLAAAFAFTWLLACHGHCDDGLRGAHAGPATSEAWPNGLSVGAYRIGMIMGGGLFASGVCATKLVRHVPDHGPRCLALTILPVAYAARTAAGRHVGAASVFRRAWRRGDRQAAPAPAMLPFMLLVCFYKFGDSNGRLAGRTVMRDCGLTKETIALMKGRWARSPASPGPRSALLAFLRVSPQHVLLACGLLQRLQPAVLPRGRAGFGGVGMLWARNRSPNTCSGSMATVGTVHAHDGCIGPRACPARTTRCLACAVGPSRWGLGELRRVQGSGRRWPRLPREGLPGRLRHLRGGLPVSGPGARRETRPSRLQLSDRGLTKSRP